MPSGAVAAVSYSGELALLLGCKLVFTTDCAGTLATVSLSGGSPRNLAEHIAYADWNPNGKQLVVSVYSSEGARLEFPPGHVLYQQKTGWFGHPRFSPNGKMVAYENHPVIGNDDGAIELVDLNGNRTVLAKGWLSLEGLSWTPDGKEIWFAATDEATTTTGYADKICAVSLSSKQRTVLTLPDVARLHDISRDGRVLLSHETWRLQLKGLFPGDTAEHPYSWLDSTNATGISNDGRSITFYE
jgi:Tol biopolymer transport system component